MKAEEVRIGNLLWNPYGKQPEAVYSIRPVQALNTNHEINEEHPDFFQPIPLTEEWLVKFGFVDNSYGRFYKYIDNEFYITVSFKDYAHTQLSEHPVEVNDYSLPLDCKYVHQLQNLYFALTGEELTIAEP